MCVTQGTHKWVADTTPRGAQLWCVVGWAPQYITHLSTFLHTPNHCAGHFHCSLHKCARRSPRVAHHHDLEHCSPLELQHLAQPYNHLDNLVMTLYSPQAKIAVV